MGVIAWILIGLLAGWLATQILGGRVVYSQERKGPWVAGIEMERSEIENATNAPMNLIPDQLDVW